jgi:tripeptidyl-peptidase-1
VLAAQYNLGTPPAKAAANSSMSVSEFQGQMWDQANCDEFAEACKLGFNVTVNRQVGSNTPAQGPGSVEALLDIQYIKAIGGAIPLTDIYVDDYSLLTWCKTLIGLADAPLINSVSYGNDEKQQSGVAYMDSCNIQFQAAALRGLSILFASGDQGAYGRSGAGIFGNEPFHPDFPAGSPYITSVGGTNFATKGQLGSETAWSGSGGGFSNTFGIPDFQAAAVSAYKANFSSVLPPSKLWNNTGRGYPDVSALGGPVDGYCVNQGRDGFAGVAGTSAACPVTAAVFAKLNDLRSSAGSPALGFLNPWIYKNADAFNDVTSGVNNGGHKHGFTATKGWDPATGVGTPDFEKLRNVV